MRTLFTLLVLLPFFANAQAPTWQWAKQSIGAGHDYGINIDTDPSGNCYVTGTFQPPSVVIGNDTLYASTSNNSGFFVAKYDRNGNCLWARTITGSSSMNPTGIRLNTSSDELMVTGYFKSVGYISFGSDSIVSNTFFDVFLAKYDTSGNSLWTINAGPSAWNGQINYDVGLDDSGNSYLAGTFEDSVYLKKYDPTGAQLFIKKFVGGMLNTFFWSIAVNGNGDNVIAGYFSNTSLQFDTVMVPLISNGYTILLIKLDAQGNILWVKNDGHVASLYKPDVAMDALDNIFVTGYFNGPTCTFGNTTLTNLGADDIFLTKYDASGNFLWAQHAGGVHFDLGISIDTDNNLNCYMTGMFRLNAAFGNYFLFTGGDPDIFVAKYDPNGTVLWAKQAGGAEVDVGYGIALDDSANCYVIGRFTSYQPVFDNIFLQNTGAPGTAYDFFIARLGADSLTGIAEASNQNHFAVYPNPLVTESELILSDETTDGSYQIFDIRGALIRSQSFYGNRIMIKRETLAAGTYILRVNSADTVSEMLLMVN